MCCDILDDQIFFFQMGHTLLCSNHFLLRILKEFDQDDLAIISCTVCFCRSYPQYSLYFVKDIANTFVNVWLLNFQISWLFSHYYGCHCTLLLIHIPKFSCFRYFCKWRRLIIYAEPGLRCYIVSLKLNWCVWNCLCFFLFDIAFTFASDWVPLSQPVVATLKLSMSLSGWWLALSKTKYSCFEYNC